MAIQDAELRIVLRAVGTELLAGMREMQGSVDQATRTVATRFKETEAAVSTSMGSIRERVTVGFSGIQGSIRAFGTLAEVGLAILGVERAISSIVGSQQAWAKESEHLHQALGLNFTDVATLGVAAKEADAPVEQLDVIIRGLGLHLNSNEREFRNLHVTTRETATGGFLPLFQIIQNSLGVIDQYREGTDQLVIAQRLFGRGATAETIEGLRKTVANFDHAREVAKDYGLVVGADGVLAAQAFTRAQADLGFAALGVKNIFAQALRPEIERVIDYVRELAKGGELQAWARDSATEIVGLGEDVVGLTRFLVDHATAVKSAAVAWGIYKLALLSASEGAALIGTLTKIQAAIQGVQITQGLATAFAPLSAVGGSALVANLGAQITAVASAVGPLSEEAAIAATAVEAEGLAAGSAAIRFANLGTAVTAAAATVGPLTEEVVAAGTALETMAAVETTSAAATAGLAGTMGTLRAAGIAATTALGPVGVAAVIAAGIAGVLTYTDSWHTLGDVLEGVSRDVHDELRPELLLLQDAVTDIANNHQLRGWADEARDAFKGLVEQIKELTGLDLSKLNLGKPVGVGDVIRQLVPGLGPAQEALRRHEEDRHPELSPEAQIAQAKEGSFTGPLLPGLEGPPNDLTARLSIAREALLHLKTELDSTKAAVTALASDKNHSAEVYTAAVERMRVAESRFKDQETAVRTLETEAGVKPAGAGKTAPPTADELTAANRKAFTVLSEEQAAELAAVERNQAAKLAIVERYTAEINRRLNISAEDQARFKAHPEQAVAEAAAAEEAKDPLRANQITDFLTQQKVLNEQLKKAAEERRTLEDIAAKTAESHAIRELDLEKRTVEERQKLGTITRDEATSAEVGIEQRRLAIVQDFLTKELALEVGSVEKVAEIRARLAKATTAAETQQIFVEFGVKDDGKFQEGLKKLEVSAQDTADKIHAIEFKLNDEKLVQQASVIRGAFDQIFSDLSGAVDRLASALIQGNQGVVAGIQNLRAELGQARSDMEYARVTAGRTSDEFIQARQRMNESQLRLNQTIERQSAVENAVAAASNELYKQLTSQLISFVLEIVKYQALRLASEIFTNAKILDEDRITGVSRIALLAGDSLVGGIGKLVGGGGAAVPKEGEPGFVGPVLPAAVGVAGAVASGVTGGSATPTGGGGLLSTLFELVGLGGGKSTSGAAFPIPLPVLVTNFAEGFARGLGSGGPAGFLGGVGGLPAIPSPIAASSGSAPPYAIGAPTPGGPEAALGAGLGGDTEALTAHYAQIESLTQQSQTRITGIQEVGEAQRLVNLVRSLGQQVAHVVTSIATTVAHIVTGESAKTVAKAAGTTAQLGVEQAGVAAEKGIAAEKALTQKKSVLNDAAEAAANAYAGVTETIPGLPGIILGAAAAAAVFAAVLGYEAVISAEGGLTEAGPRTLGVLHPEEKVLDPKVAATVRELARSERGQAILRGASETFSAGQTQAHEAGFDVGPEGAVRPLVAGSLVLPKAEATAVRAGAVESLVEKSSTPAPTTPPPVVSTVDRLLGAATRSDAVAHSAADTTGAIKALEAAPTPRQDVTLHPSETRHEKTIEIPATRRADVERTRARVGTTSAALVAPTHSPAPGSGQLSAETGTPSIAPEKKGLETRVAAAPSPTLPTPTISAESGLTTAPSRGVLAQLHPEEKVLDPRVAEVVRRLASTPEGRALLEAGSFDVSRTGGLHPLAGGALVLPKSLAETVRTARSRVENVHREDRLTAKDALSRFNNESTTHATTASTSSTSTASTPSASTLNSLFKLGALSLASGIHRVPADNTVAVLHRDERVLTSTEARSADAPASAFGAEPEAVSGSAPGVGGAGGVGGASGRPGGAGALGGRQDVEHKGTVEHKHDHKHAHEHKGATPHVALAGGIGGTGAGVGSGDITRVSVVQAPATIHTQVRGGHVDTAVQNTVQTQTAGGGAQPVKEQGTHRVIVENVPLRIAFSAITTAFSIMLAPFGIGTAISVGFMSAFAKGGDVPEDMLAKLHAREMVLKPEDAETIRMLTHTREIHQLVAAATGPSLRAPTATILDAERTRDLDRRFAEHREEQRRTAETITGESQAPQVHLNAPITVHALDGANARDVYERTSHDLAKILSRHLAHNPSPRRHP